MPITGSGIGNSSTTPGSTGEVSFWTSSSSIGGDPHFTYDTATDVLHVHKLAGDATDGLLIESESGTDVGILGMANTANATWYGTHNFDGTGTAVSIANNLKVSGSIGQGIDPSGDVGIYAVVSNGSLSASRYAMRASYTQTDATNGFFPAAFRMDSSVNAGATAIGFINSATVITSTASGHTGTITTFYGGEFSARHNSTTAGATITNAYGGSFTASLFNATSAGTISNCVAGQFYTNHSTSAAGTVATNRVLYVRTSVPAGGITTHYGIMVETPTTNLGTITTAYGLNIQRQSVGTTRYGMLIGNSTVDKDGSGIWFHTDTNLYRSAADTLSTDDALTVGTNIAVGTTVSTNHRIYGIRTVTDNTTQTVIRGDLTITGATTSSFPVTGNFSTGINATSNAVFFAAGVFFSARSELTQTGTITEQWGVYGDAWHRSQGNVGTLGGGRTFVSIISGSAGTVTAANGFNATIVTNAVAQSTVTDATNASPIVITTSGAHGLSSNMSVTVAGVLGNTAANGNWVITVLSGTTFSLNGSTGSGAYTSGGTVDARNAAMTTATGYSSVLSHSGKGAITTFNWFDGTASFSAGSATITTFNGLRIQNPGANATITTLYGIRINDLTRGSTNYGIYFDGTGTNNRIAWGGTTASIHASSTSALTLTGAVTGSSSITSTTGIVAGTRITSAVSTLTDGATVALDASLGNTFLLTAAGDRTINAPTNAVSGQRIIIAHKASGANRTLTLTTGSSGAFRFGTDITGLTVTTSGLTDYIGCVYNSADARWDVVSYRKGY